LGRLLLAEDGEKGAFEVEELEAHRRRGKLRVPVPGELREELALDGDSRVAELRPPGLVRGRIRLCGAPLEEIAPESEESGLRPGVGRLGAPFPLDAEEARHEAGEGSTALDEETRAGEGIERGGVGPVGVEPGRELGLNVGELVAKGAVQFGEPPLVVEVLVSEALDAEREVPLGGPRWNGRSLQTDCILTRTGAGPDRSALAGSSGRELDGASPKPPLSIRFHRDMPGCRRCRTAGGTSRCLH
jgi:hypothetical protein